MLLYNGRSWNASGICSCKLFLHMKTNIIQNMTKTLTGIFLITFIFLSLSRSVTSSLYMAHLLSWTNSVFCRTRFRIHRYVAPSFLRTRPFFYYQKNDQEQKISSKCRNKNFYEGKDDNNKETVAFLEVFKTNAGLQYGLGILNPVLAWNRVTYAVLLVRYVPPTHFTPPDATSKNHCRSKVNEVIRYLLWLLFRRSDSANLLSKHLELLYSKIRRMDRRLSHRHRCTYNRDRAKPRGGGGVRGRGYYWLLTGWALIRLLTNRQDIPVSAGLKLRLISSDTGRQGIPVLCRVDIEPISSDVCRQGFPALCMVAPRDPWSLQGWHWGYLVQIPAARGSLFCARYTDHLPAVKASLGNWDSLGAGVIILNTLTCFNTAAVSSAFTLHNKRHQRI